MQETSKIENIKELIKETICEMNREEEIEEYLRLKNEIFDFKKRLKAFVICIIIIAFMWEIKIILSNQVLNIDEQIYPLMIIFLALFLSINCWAINYFYKKVTNKPIEDINSSDIKKLRKISKM